MKPPLEIMAKIRRHSPVELASEAVWRAWRPFRSSRLLRMLFRGQPGVQFRPVPYYRPELAAASNGADGIVAYANEICSGRFSLLGYEAASLGFPPFWNVDFVSGYEWCPAPAAHLPFVSRGNGSDVTVPWEISRLQFLPVLAKAHLLTGDPRYRIAACELFSDWNSKNPVGMGVNWVQPMEVALRGMSLCFTLSLLSPLGPGEQAWGNMVAGSIWQHLIYTEAQIEFSPLIYSNHYLSNVIGLHCMATFLEGPGMERRRRYYRRNVQQEMLRQVYADGGDYEASSSYHLLVLQMFTTSWLLMRAESQTPAPPFTNRLRAMYRYLAELASPEGRLPHIGDSDDGRVELMVSDLRQMTTLPPERRDSLLVPGALGIGDALFGLGCGGDGSDSAWYGLRPRNQRSVRERLAQFPISGVAIHRTNDAEVVFFAIPNGIHGKGSHTHNDKLSLVLRIRGVELLCDSGTCWYTRDVERRNSFRSTAAHNTIVVDGAEQNIIGPTRSWLFKLGDEAKVSGIECSDTPEEIRLSASHSGYHRIGVGHRRMVRLHPGGLSVEDTLSGTEVHSFEVFWHLPAVWQVTAAKDGKGFEISGPSTVNLNVIAEVPLELSHDTAPLSRTYGGAVETGARIRIAGSGRLPMTVLSSFTW